MYSPLRELDIKIHELLFEEPVYKLLGNPEPSLSGGRILPSYTTNMGDAWWLIEFFRKREFRFVIVLTGNDVALSLSYRNSSSIITESSSDGNVALLIVKSILKLHETHSQLIGI